jgi:hypothetical protein
MAAGIDDIIKENGHVALRLAPNCTGLNPPELVCGDIRDRTAATNLKEMQTFCGKVFVEYTKENTKN